MATVTNPPTPPPPAATSPPRSLQRKPVPVTRLPLSQHERGESQDSFSGNSLPVGQTAEPATIRDAPVSPVRVNFQPDNWARPTNVSIEGGYQVAPPPPPHMTGIDQRSSVTLPPPYSPTSDQSRTLTPKQTYTGDFAHRSGQEMFLNAAEVGYMEAPAVSDLNRNSFSDSSRSDDPNRHSRESDATASTQQQMSTDSSAETSASSISGGLNEACDNRVVPDESSPEESIIEGSIQEGQQVPQLQYHHQPYLPRVSSVPLESNSRHSSRSDLAEPPGMAINRHLTPNSFNRRSSMPRPQSSYSLYSELGPRGRSPSYGAANPRTSSIHSRRSPETRPTSYAELLNVPYPQQAPAPITIDNSYLRNNVGSNASLLSAQKTLEMYRQNVKKTNDFSIQYSFAVFLISTAQEQGLNLDEPSRKKASPKGSPLNENQDTSPTELVREAKSILTRLANGGYPFAQYYLADGFASGLFNKGKEDYNSAFPLFVLAAKHGHAESGYRAGLCYEFGWGCRKDPAKAVQFLRTAASKNHPGAMTRLGKACLSGDLGENRYREGVKWLKRATESADAMYNAAPYHLGTLYETGYGDDIFKDESYAAELFTQAAELGHAEASYRMGDAYEHGKLNCPRDPALSVHFYTGAAERGHAAAMMGLCAWYMVGADPILEKDEEEAYEWARRSADLGYVKAEYAVGYFTEMGIGCRRDILEANVWYVKAADSGDERAKQRLAAIRAAVSGGGTPMDVAPPRNGKMKKNQANDKDCVVM
ncbi:HCP-like protein [Annulohypoxylon maeteangense]|uniref:HCP-like protein n=1 Tax=Annulohypoxylon maeteangense TaxID=1927788 RepID=UPI002007B8FF|nr:HCP-like protein [Annulohypoxylon maeteangense]KAI0890042.1 HCP-like protein [Annulohypoxylon maeteangense]